jgi:PTS system nitrogen regulatory IIA component
MTQDASRYHDPEVDLGRYLSSDRIDVAVEVTSRKRLLEFMAASLARNSETPDQQSIFHQLVERERLGSTGVGQGIALPHSRMEELDEARISIATLASPIDYESPDAIPVDIVFALIVPEHANADHLGILARIAGIFSRKNARNELLSLSGANDIIDWINP